METKLLGLLISKHSFSGRNFIGKVLLKEGQIITVSFYGGAAGGSKKKSSILEVGFVLAIELQKNKR